MNQKIVKIVAISVAVLAIIGIGIWWDLSRSKNFAVTPDKAIQVASGDTNQELTVPTTSTTESVQNPASSTPAEVKEKPKTLTLADQGISITKSGDKSILKDTQTGMSFSYPTEWGPIGIEEEQGGCAPTTIDPCNLRMYKFSNFGDANVFLVTETIGHHNNPPGRDGFWGDEAGAITKSFTSECTPKNKCELITNKEGTVIAKEKGLGEFGDDEVSAMKKTKYYTFSDKGPYHGMILTASRFAEPGSFEEKLFEDIVIASLKLSNH